MYTSWKWFYSCLGVGWVRLDFRLRARPEPSDGEAPSWAGEGGCQGERGRRDGELLMSAKCSGTGQVQMKKESVEGLLFAQPLDALAAAFCIIIGCSRQTRKYGSSCCSKQHPSVHWLIKKSQMVYFSNRDKIMA